MFKQTQKYGCGLYAIANLLGDERLIDEVELKKTKIGMTNGLINKVLINSGREYFVDTLFFTLEQNMKIPEDLMLLRPLEGYIFPMLIEIKETKDSLNHVVAVHVYSNGEMTVFDSVKENPYKTTLKYFCESQFRVYGLHGISEIYGGERVFLIENN